jgi:purine-binding chemotaxis protein CheW
MTTLFQNEKKMTDTQRFLEFYLGKESYAVDLLKVKEVITPPEMTPIPKCPPYVCGLMNLRGLVLTVIDLRKKLGIHPEKESSENAVIIFDLGDRMVGAMVDSIQKVLTIPQDHVKPVPDSDGSQNANFLGILQHDNRLTMWLDPEKVMDQHAATSHVRAA